MSGHTPGPWLVERDPEAGYAKFGIYSPDDHPVVSHFHAIENEADAILIAAAPDLLEALETFVAEYVDLVQSGDAGFWNPEHEPKVIMARKAIAKARTSLPAPLSAGRMGE